MNLKSYFRGIGAGMIVTAIIMGVSMPKFATAEPVEKETLLETVEAGESAKKIEEAKSTVSSDEAFEEEVRKAVSNNEALRNEDKDSKEDVSAGEETEVITEEELKEEILPEAIDPMPDDEEGFTNLGETVEIKVISGDSSVSVARRIYEAGLVESAVEFDEFLCANGYDKTISVGTYEIPVGADFDTIGRIITRRY